MLKPKKADILSCFSQKKDSKAHLAKKRCEISFTKNKDYGGVKRDAKTKLTNFSEKTASI